MDIGLLLRGVKEMMAAAAAPLAPLTSSLAPERASTAVAPAATGGAGGAAAGNARNGPIAAPFKVGLTPDFYNSEGAALYADFGQRPPKTHAHTRARTRTHAHTRARTPFAPDWPWLSMLERTLLGMLCPPMEGEEVKYPPPPVSSRDGTVLALW